MESAKRENIIQEKLCGLERSPVLVNLVPLMGKEKWTMTAAGNEKASKREAATLLPPPRPKKSHGLFCE